MLKQTRLRTSSLVFLSCFALTTFFASCKPAPQPEPGKKEPSTSAKKTELFKGWENPSAVLVLTGDQHGYLEPCGCSERQSGGLARRADLMRQLVEERKWPTVALDNGGLLNDQRVTYKQSQIKFAAIRNGLNQIGYKGMNLGGEELMLGADALYTASINDQANEGFDLPFMGSNVTIYGSKELGTPLETRILQVGTLKIGVAAIVGDSTKKKLDQSGITNDPSLLKIDDPNTVLPAMLEKLKADKPDLLVLLSHADMDESRAFATAYPDFNIVVTAHSVEDPKQEAEYVGKTLFVKVGKKGKHAAVVGLFPNTDQPLKLAMIELEMDHFENAPAMADLMREYQANLKTAWPELMAEKIADPGHQFVGAQDCGTCHTFAYKVWGESKHAHAFESLEKGRPAAGDPKGEPKYDGDWITRVFDPECLCCHTTGWDPQSAQRYESGFQDMQSTPHLAGQQCENCHGAGSGHSGLEKSVKAGGAVNEEVLAGRASMRLTLPQAKANVCNKCHDLDNSPKFDFDKYWPKVNHSGRKD